MREQSWEYTGKSVEEATQIALEELGLEKEDIHVEIIEEPQKGFLGLGGKEARIKVEMVGEWEIQGNKDRETREIETEEPRKSKISDDSKLEQVKMIKEIIKILDIDAVVEAEEKEESIFVDIWGDDVAVLIGKNGNTMDSLQYLVNVSSRRRGENEKRVVIDIEGYRRRKKTRLEKKVKDLAYKVKSDGKTIEMQPMSASDRKTVHIALRKIEGVWSESTGEEPERRVLIHPEES